MNEFASKLTSAPFWIKVIGIVIVHLIFNLLSGFYFMFDDFSFQNQLIHSIIHLSFLIMVIRLLYVEEKYNKLPKTIGWISLGVILILNLIPYSQELILHDNGFVPMWAQAPQVKYGWPNVFVRVFTSEIQNMRGDDVLNPLIHYNCFFLNLYEVSILIVLELKLVSFCQIFFKNES